MLTVSQVAHDNRSTITAILARTLRLIPVIQQHELYINCTQHYSFLNKSNPRHTITTNITHSVNRIVFVSSENNWKWCIPQERTRCPNNERKTNKDFEKLTIALAVICFYFTQLDNGKYLQSPWRFWKNERERLLSIETLFYLWCARLLLLWYNAIRFARPRNLLEKNIHFHPVLSSLVSQVAKYRVDINYSRNSMTASYSPVLSASMFYTHPSPRSTPQGYHEPKNACRNQV